MQRCGAPWPRHSCQGSLCRAFERLALCARLRRSRARAPSRLRVPRARSSLPRVMCSALPWPRPASLLAEVVADAMLKFYWSFLGFLLGLPSFASTSPRAPSLRRAAL
eukprot:1410832-Prymnesium_polylepis.1